MENKMGTISELGRWLTPRFAQLSNTKAAGRKIGDSDREFFAGRQRRKKGQPEKIVADAPTGGRSGASEGVLPPPSKDKHSVAIPYQGVEQGTSSRT